MALQHLHVLQSKIDALVDPFLEAIKDQKGQVLGLAGTRWSTKYKGMSADNMAAKKKEVEAKLEMVRSWDSGCELAYRDVCADSAPFHLFAAFGLPFQEIQVQELFGCAGGDGGRRLSSGGSRGAPPRVRVREGGEKRRGAKRRAEKARYVRNVDAANSAAVSNCVITSSFATRFAHRSCWRSRRR